MAKRAAKRARAGDPEPSSSALAGSSNAPGPSSAAAAEVSGSCSGGEGSAGTNHFERLPDELVQRIFSELETTEAYEECRLWAVDRRFRQLVRGVHWRQLRVEPLPATAGGPLVRMEEYRKRLDRITARVRSGALAGCLRLEVGPACVVRSRRGAGGCKGDIEASIKAAAAITEMLAALSTAPAPLEHVRFTSPRGTGWDYWPEDELQRELGIAAPQPLETAASAFLTALHPAPLQALWLQDESISSAVIAAAAPGCLPRLQELNIQSYSDDSICAEEMAKLARIWPGVKRVHCHLADGTALKELSKLKLEELSAVVESPEGLDEALEAFDPGCVTELALPPSSVGPRGLAAILRLRNLNGLACTEVVQSPRLNWAAVDHKLESSDGLDRLSPLCELLRAPIAMHTFFVCIRLPDTLYEQAVPLCPAYPFFAASRVLALSNTGTLAPLGLVARLSSSLASTLQLGVAPQSLTLGDGQAQNVTVSFAGTGDSLLRNGTLDAEFPGDGISPAVVRSFPVSVRVRGAEFFPASLFFNVTMNTRTNGAPQVTNRQRTRPLKFSLGSSVCWIRGLNVTNQTIAPGATATVSFVVDNFCLGPGPVQVSTVILVTTDAEGSASVPLPATISVADGRPPIASATVEGASVYYATAPLRGLRLLGAASQGVDAPIVSYRWSQVNVFLTPVVDLFNTTMPTARIGLLSDSGYYQFQLAVVDALNKTSSQIAVCVVLILVVQANLRLNNDFAPFDVSYRTNEGFRANFISRLSLVLRVARNALVNVLLSPGSVDVQMYVVPGPSDTPSSIASRMGALTQPEIETGLGYRFIIQNKGFTSIRITNVSGPNV
eukprot:tig00000215_g18539.t1